MRGYLAIFCSAVLSGSVFAHAVFAEKLTEGTSDKDLSTEQVVKSGEEIESRIGGAFSAGENQPDEEQPASTSPKVDLAFGAYQRGMYLTAFKLALPRAEAGDAAAQTLIAELYDLGRGIGKDAKKAAEWYSVAAASGNREAKFAMSMKLLQGQDVEQDTKRALQMMEEAADAGHPVAMFNFANHIIDQRPTTAGYRRALPYLEKAAEYRLADAYYLLAQIYQEGLATGYGEPLVARKWLIKAAESGIDTAQVDLAISYTNGFDGPKDLEKAHQWFEAAARTGNVIAQNRLAHMLFQGSGVKKAPEEAAVWHILAARAGRADPILDQYMLQLDMETRQKAISRANRWPF
ncbi:MAG: tetratricopeptide repeat protein [Rhizobiaceae bacterium]|nr:tetratricopeptide repeat protein [Rhizobiaceae bacterium]